MLDIDPETLAVFEASIDTLVSQFADLVLIERNRGASESDLAALFAAAITPPASAEFPPDVLDWIKTRAYEMLSRRLDQIWGRVVIPESPLTLH